MQSCLLNDCYGAFEKFVQNEAGGQPRVSVLMAVHNGQETLVEAIQSVLSQQYEDFEFLIADDGSTDETWNLLVQCAAKDARISIYRQSNIGLTKSLNRLLLLAKGEYVARQDADDVWFPDKLCAQLRVMDDNMSLGVLGSAAATLTREGAVVEGASVVSGTLAVARALACYNPVVHSSVLMRRSLLVKHGVYDDVFDCAQDYELWLRLKKYCGIDNLEKVLCLRRESPGMISVRKARRQRCFALRAKYNHLSWRDVSFPMIAWGVKDLLFIVAPLKLHGFARTVLKSARQMVSKASTL